MMLRNGFLITLLMLALRAGGPQAAGPQDANREVITGRPVTPWVILRQGLTDSNTDHRRQSILAAASIGITAESLKFIEDALLRDKVVIVRKTAATVLGQMKASDSIPAMQQALDDNSSEVRFTVARALAEMGEA